MHPLIDDNRQAISDLCRRHGVRRLEAFGSILRGDFDVDIVVEFEPTAAGSFQNFLSLKESLEALLRRSVDLVELHAVRDCRLRYYIEKSRSPIYDAACPRRLPRRHRVLRERRSALSRRRHSRSVSRGRENQGHL